MSRSDAVTACSGTGELSDRENEVVLRTSVGFCEDEAESDDDMKGEEEGRRGTARIGSDSGTDEQNFK